MTTWDAGADLPLIVESPIRVGFLTSDDPLNPRSWSGTFSCMYRALERRGVTVIRLGPAPSWLKQLERAAYVISLWASKWTGRGYDFSHSRLLSRFYGWLFDRRLHRRPVDVIFAPAASTEVAYLNTTTPIIYTSDSTYGLMEDYYPYLFSQISGLSRREGNLLEKLAIARSELLTYPSSWAAASAVEEYGAPPERVHVVPYGANVDPNVVISWEDVLHKDLSGACRLLFLGVDWERKGGGLALETMLELRARGVHASLTICGCRPPVNVSHSALHVVPYLDKTQPQQSTEWTRLMRGSHFLVVPSRSEAYGVVFCEASAFGIPSITTDTGGITAAVREGVNGYALPLDAGPESYADIIHALWSDHERYRQLSESARNLYENLLNWDAWSSNIKALVEATIVGRKR